MSTRDFALDTGWLLSDPRRRLSWDRAEDRDAKSAGLLRQYIYLQMAASDLVLDEEAMARVELPEGLLANLEEKNRLLTQLRAPIDQRIEGFLEAEFAGESLANPLRLPRPTLVLDRHGLAKERCLACGAYLACRIRLPKARRRGTLRSPGIALDCQSLSPSTRDRNISVHCVARCSRKVSRGLV